MLKPSNPTCPDNRDDEISTHTKLRNQFHVWKENIMKREHLLRLTALLATLVAAMICGLLLNSCSNDCPTCPTDKPVEHYKGWLYYTDLSPVLYNIYKVDMETDSIVDSLTYGDPSVAGYATAMSSDGRYLVAWFGDTYLHIATTRLYDAQTLTMISEIPQKAYACFFDTENRWILAYDVNATGGAQFLRLSLPDLTVLATDTVHNFWPIMIDPARHKIYGQASETSSKPVVYHRGFYSYDYVQHQMQLIPILWTPNDTCQVFTPKLSGDGNTLYFIGMEFTGATIFGSIAAAFDLGTRALLWHYPLVGASGGIDVSPDGKEVWLTDPGAPGYDWDSGTIFILDAATGRFLQGISMYGYQPDNNPHFCLPGRQVLFSPTGEKVYVCTDITMTNPYGTVVVVDAKKRTITKLLRPDMHSEPMSLCLGPKR
jgi:hypothetical protein